MRSDGRNWVMEPFVRSNLPGDVGGNSEKKFDVVDTVHHSNKEPPEFQEYRSHCVLALGNLPVLN